jgi:Flp pilus assembly pilin Flp
MCVPVTALLDRESCDVSNSKPNVARNLSTLVRDALSDRRGAVSTEYVVLVGTVGLAFVFAAVTVGPRLIKDFQRARDITASPVP